MTDEAGPWTSTLPEEDGEWRTKVLWVWHFAYALVIVIAVVLLADHGASPWGYAALAGYAAAYAGLMAPSMQRPGGYRAYLYLAVAVGASAVMAFTAPAGLVILYVVFPHLWAVLDTVWIRTAAIGLTAVLAVAGTAVHDGEGGTSVVGALVTVAIAMLTSLGLGFVTSVLIHESERRGRLIEELERTRAELAEANHEAGVLAERQRLAREIHDTLAQGFTSLVMLVQAAEATLDTDVESTRRRLDLAARTARENLADARALVAAQDPVELAGGTLQDALGRAVAGLAEELEIAAEFRVAGTPRDLPATTQVVLVRTVQECLANVRKHAAATSVDAELAYRPDSVRLVVRDNGCGFAAPAGNGPGGYGLRGMRARIEQARGTLEITGAPGEGTTVRVEIP
ncbi:sensor histidine kinase [Yinghuangia soli]|uniref:Sensor histidine kinase n=1 Tax=Yinghuangia soli TaxID=2908204 RepID=A0AA41PYN6_9ACTN|nr:sensor histidine kinase [Yinghuangia soli]MCF2528295.1 sensor histidine kinase [Yinghuangia soli]